MRFEPSCCNGQTDGRTDTTNEANSRSSLS